MTKADDRSTQGHDSLFRVHVDGVVGWLATATHSADGWFAATYGVDDHDTFRRGADGMHDRIQMLVDQAQSDAVLHSADHDVVLWQVADGGFLLTLDGPTPPRLCSVRLMVDELVPDKTSASAAAVAVLLAVAQVANQLLTEHARTRAATTGPAAFPRIHHVTPAVDPPPPATSTSPTRPPHHGR